MGESQPNSIHIRSASRGPNDNRTDEQSNSHSFFLKYGTEIARRKIIMHRQIWVVVILRRSDEEF